MTSDSMSLIALLNRSNLKKSYFQAVVCSLSGYTSDFYTIWNNSDTYPGTLTEHDDYTVTVTLPLSGFTDVNKMIPILVDGIVETDSTQGVDYYSFIYSYSTTQIQIKMSYYNSRPSRLETRFGLYVIEYE